MHFIEIGKIIQCILCNFHEYHFFCNYFFSSNSSFSPSSSASCSFYNDLRFQVGVQRRMDLVVNFSYFFIFFCFLVDMSDQVHNVEAIHS